MGRVIFKASVKNELKRMVVYSSPTESSSIMRWRP